MINLFFDTSERFLAAAGALAVLGFLTVFTGPAPFGAVMIVAGLACGGAGAVCFIVGVWLELADACRPDRMP